MVQPLPSGYVFDPEDPRAPSLEQWDRMHQDERARVVAMLPPDLPLEMVPNEGDRHRKAKRGALDALDGFFRRTGRRIYLSSEIAVYYPGERRFAPDLCAVTDVEPFHGGAAGGPTPRAPSEPYDRDSWVVAKEGKGLDFVLEVHVAGDRRKDEKTNVERYARLGVQEYFYFDRTRQNLAGYRLPTPAGSAAKAPPRVYQRLMPQAGRFASGVLGLDLALEGSRLRFFAGNAALDDADEMIARLGSMLDKVIEGQMEAERLAEDLAARLAEEQRFRAEEQRLHAEELAEARAEIERLRGKAT